MSISKKITVLCDHPECNTWDAHGDRESWSSDTAAKARTVAKRNGWTVVGIRDYCQKHSRGIPERQLITDHAAALYPKGSVGYSERRCVDCGAKLFQHQFLPTKLI